MTIPTPANDTNAPINLTVLGTSIPIGHREQRGHHRGGGDQQRRVTGRDALQGHRPQDLIAAEPDDPEQQDPSDIAAREADGAFTHPQQDDQGDRCDAVAQEGEAHRRQDADRSLDHDEIAGPEDHDDERREFGHPPLAGGRVARADRRPGAGHSDARRFGGRLVSRGGGVGAGQALS